MGWAIPASVPSSSVLQEATCCRCPGPLPGVFSSLLCHLFLFLWVIAGTSPPQRPTPFPPLLPMGYHPVLRRPPLITTGKSMSCTCLHFDFPLPRRTGSARTSTAPCLFPPASQCSHLTWHLPEAQGTFPWEARRPSCPSGEKSCPFGSSAHTSAWSMLTLGHPCLEKVTDGVTNARSSTRSGPHSLAV